MIRYALLCYKSKKYMLINIFLSENFARNLIVYIFAT